MLYPQDQTEPSDFSATDWLWPAAAATTPLSPLTCTGVFRSVVVLSPSWPTSLIPQAQSVPSDFTAIPSEGPVATATMPLKPLTCTGVVDREAIMPVPSAPCWLFPQAQTVPSDFST